MKESITRNDFSKFLLKFLCSCLMVFSFGATSLSAQNFMDPSEANTLLRQVEQSIYQSANLSPFVAQTKESFKSTNPEAYAKLYVIEAVRTEIRVNAAASNFPKVVDDAVDRGKNEDNGAVFVNPSFFDAAKQYVLGLLII